MTSLGDRHSWDRGWRRFSAASTPLAGSAAMEQGYFPALLALTVVHLVLSGLVPPVEDELYYWTWSQRLSLSYYDHPPMVAYLIRLSTAIFGDNLFGIRFFASFASLTVLAILGTLSSSKTLLTWLLFTPLFFLGGVLMTPDVPFVLFWTLYLAWTVSTNRSYASWSLDPVTRVYHRSPVSLARWIGGGVILGLGLLSKYPMVLAIPCAFLLYATRYRWRAWIVGFAVHLATAAVVASPIFFFNLRHDFAPLLFQWHHAGGGGPNFWNFIGSQVLLLGAIPFLMLPLALLKVKQLSQEPRLHACFWLSVPPLCFFLVKAMSSSLEANWAIVGYIGLFPIAQRLLDQSSFRSLNRGIVVLSFALPVAASAALLVNVFYPLPGLTPGQDRVTRFKMQYELSSKVAQDFPKARIFTPTYQWTSYLRYRGMDAEQLHPEGRANQFTVVPVDVCAESSTLVLEQSGHRAGVTQCFAGRKVLKEYPLVVRGELRETWHVVRYTRLADATSRRAVTPQDRLVKRERAVGPRRGRRG